MDPFNLAEHLELRVNDSEQLMYCLLELSMLLLDRLEGLFNRLIIIGMDVLIFVFDPLSDPAWEQRVLLVVYIIDYQREIVGSIWLSVHV